MAKGPKDKTLGQIKNDIKKGEEGKEEVIRTSEQIEKPKKLFNPMDVLLLIFVALLFGFALLERSRILATVSGTGLILVIIKIAYGQYTK